MKMSRRAKRMERNHRRHRGGGGLNLVSLMDIFTILVFFLLVNSSSVQQPPTSKRLTLPQASSEKPPAESLVVVVSSDEILVQGRHIATIAEAQSGDAPVILKLSEELHYQAGKSQIPPGTDGRELTIMGDKEIPYKLLKRIMLTSTEAGYTTLSLAVSRKTKG